MNYDVIIVGGSFSGLSCAYRLASQGLKVCLFEKNKIGETTKSTGILTSTAMKEAEVPKKFMENKLKGLNIFSPSMKKLKIQFPGEIFGLSHTLELLKWLKEQAISSGVEIFENQFCKKISINKENVNCEGKEGKMIIFATGTSSIDVRNVHWQKQDFYVGLEYIASLTPPVDEIDFWHLFLDADISPGYISWIAPMNNEKNHVGVLKKANDKTPATLSISKFLKKAKFSVKRIYQSRAGLVPLSGPIKKSYGHRHIFVGDAAGHVGALFSNGIDFSFKVAKIVGEILPDLIDEPSEKNLKKYEIEWKKEIGRQLQEQLFLRRLYNRFNDNKKLEKLFGLISAIPQDEINEILRKFYVNEKINLYKLAISEWPALIKAFLQFTLSPK